MAGAILASILSVGALVRVASQPRLATTLAAETPLLQLVTPEGLLVVHSGGAYRVRSNLTIEPIVWNEYGKIIAVRSVSSYDGPGITGRSGRKIGILVSIERNGPPSLESLEIDGNQMGAFFQRHARPVGMIGDAVYYEEDGKLLGGGPNVPSESLEGVVEIDGQPYVLIGERGAHWLLDWNRQLHPLPEGAWSVWSASLLRPPLNSPSRVPYLDAHGKTHAFAPAGAPVLRVEADGTIVPVEISRSLDEPGVIVTSAGERRVEVKHTRRRVLVSVDGRPAWRAVATSGSTADFQAIPLGNRWLLAGGSEAIVLDSSFARIDHGEDMFVALTSQPRALWLLMLGALGLLALMLPWALCRALQLLRVGEKDLHVGTLKLPPGAVGATSNGRVELIGNCQLRAGGHLFDLGPRPLRIDRGAPLTDGDQVYVCGELEADQAGGPWRASHRQKLGGRHYFIGRGNRDDFAAHVTARANQKLLAFALVHLTLAFTVLGFLGLRPFI
jgi:hypothetical protein